MAYQSGATVVFESVLQPKVEAEMAFVLDADLDSPDITVEEVRAAVRGECAAIEIVGSRIADWKIGIVDTVADNGSSAAFVLSPSIIPIDEVDLLVS